MVNGTIPPLIDEALIPVLEQVKDPEIPVVSVLDMGMIVSASLADRKVSVVMTPTFVGCPAIDLIRNNIREAFLKEGFKDAQVEVDLSVAWNSNRISEKGKAALEQFGLAPPPILNEEDWSAEMLDKVRCPHCKSTDTTLRSAFGSTLCRAIRFCFNCKQGFEQFKPV